MLSDFLYQGVTHHSLSLFFNSFYIVKQFTQIPSFLIEVDLAHCMHELNVYNSIAIGRNKKIFY